MNCVEVKKLLVESLDSADRGEIRAHLSECGACRELRRQLEEIDELNRTLARAAGAPRGFSGKVAVEASRARRTRVEWRILFLALAGVALLALGLQWSDGLPVSARRVADRIGGQPADAGVSADLDFRRALETYRLSRDAGDSYLEVVIPQASGGSAIVRIPSTIRIRRTNAVEGQLTKVSY